MTDISRNESFDIVIVGAGIIGLSIAWELARRSNLKICVLEKGAGIGEGSTGASSAVCRYRYTMNEVLQLAIDGIASYRHWQDYTELAEPRASFQQEGVLWMPGKNTTWADAEHTRLRSFGVPTAVIDDAELEERFPAMSSCTIAPDTVTGDSHVCRGGGRHLLELEGGYMDPTAAAQDLVEACRSKGVTVLFRSEVADVQIAAGKVTGISLTSGEHLTTPLLINAAGPWCQKLYQSAGIQVDWDIQPTRIQVLYWDNPPGLHGHVPVTVDMEGGIYFRTHNQGRQLIVGSVLEEDEREAVNNPDDFDRDADEAFRLVKLHVLHHRLPALELHGKVTGYSGLYTVNRDDVHPIVGPTNIEGFWVANGFSGHGFKLAPAIGAMVAQAVTGDSLASDTSVSMSFFAIDREPIELESKSVLA